jgi:hypothetical protein
MEGNDDTALRPALALTVPVVTWQQTFLDRQISQERAAGDCIAAEVCLREGLCWALSIPTDPSLIYVSKHHHALSKKASHTAWAGGRPMAK